MLRETEKDVYDPQEANKEAEGMVRSDGTLCEVLLSAREFLTVSLTQAAPSGGLCVPH